MNIQIKVKSSITLGKITKKIEDYPKQAAYAGIVTCTRMAVRIKENIQNEMRREFDRPTPFVLNSVRVRPATKKDPVAIVGFDIREIGGKNFYSTAQIIGQNFVGGERLVKRLEQRLHRLSVLPKGRYVVPGRAAPLDRYGNLSRGEVGKMLTQLGSYDVNPMSDKTFARLKRSNQLVSRGKYNGRVVKRSQYFVAKAGGQALGIWRVFGSGSVRPVVAFVTKPNYRRRINIFDIGLRVINRHFDDDFAKEFFKAVNNPRGNY